MCSTDIIIETYNRHIVICDKYNISFPLFSDISEWFIRLNDEFNRDIKGTDSYNVFVKYNNKLAPKLLDDAFDRIVRECVLVDEPHEHKYTYKSILRDKDWRLHKIYCDLKLFYDYVPWVL